MINLVYLIAKKTMEIVKISELNVGDTVLVQDTLFNGRLAIGEVQMAFPESGTVMILGDKGSIFHPVQPEKMVRLRRAREHYAKREPDTLILFLDHHVRAV